MDETDFTGEMGHIMTVDRTIKRAPMAKEEVDTPFYDGTVESLCLQGPSLTSSLGTCLELEDQMIQIHNGEW